MNIYIYKYYKIRKMHEYWSLEICTFENYKIECIFISFY